MRKIQIALFRDPFTLLGTLLATFSAAVILTLFVLEAVGFEGGPYVGILAYLILPAMLLVGLVLIPIGMRRHRRRRERGEVGRGFPVFDLNQDRVRWTVLGVGVLSVVNVIVFAAATYKGVEVMESNEFCGTACHTVMEPEHTAWQRSPHANVSCVDCHIGSGAGWFARSKINGAWQVASVAFDLYSRPIETPIHGMRPASETCGDCHWSANPIGNELRVRAHYAEDEANTELKSALVIRVGGPHGDSWEGIHSHLDPARTIRYLADLSRESIYDVEAVATDGTVTAWRLPVQDEEGWKEEAGELEWRTMDCTDCHNRTGHLYRLPEREIDRALETGRISRDLPFLRREGLVALAGPYSSHETAATEIARRLDAFYTENYPELDSERRRLVGEAAEELAEIYGSNVFPRMNVDWGTYPDQIGHEQWPGCFRCHDDEHETEGGELLSQDCESCHSLLAIEEENPEVLEALGL